MNHNNCKYSPNLQKFLLIENKQKISNGLKIFWETYKGSKEELERNNNIIKTKTEKYAECYCLLHKKTD